jgi:hypothetical protein
MLGLGTYCSALFMMHRIRYALKHPAFTRMLKGTEIVDGVSAIVELAF